MKLIVGIRNFAKAPKKGPRLKKLKFWVSRLWRGFLGMEGDSFYRNSGL
jgi:hypothetical protein